MAIDPTPRFQLPRYTNGQDLHPTRTDFNERMELIDELAAIALQGTRADRPMPEIQGRFFAATDTRDLFYDTGTTWLEVARIGAGGAGSTVLVGGSAAQADEGTSDRAARADHVHRIPLATANTPGAQSSEDRAKMLGATNVSTPNTHVVRDADGRTRFADPSAVTDAANKRYVDTQINTRVDGLSAQAMVDRGVTNADPDTLTTVGVYTCTTGNPSGGTAAWSLQVVPNSQNVFQYGTDRGSLRMFMRRATVSVGAWTSWVEIIRQGGVAIDVSQVPNIPASRVTAGTLDPARLPTATTSAQGALPATDKAKLDAASADVVGNALPLRTSNGNIAVPAPTASVHAAQRAYVDSKVADPNSMPLVTQSVRGAMYASDKVKLDGAAVAETGNTLMYRDANGRSRVNDPNHIRDIANKQYVDAGDATAIKDMGTLGSSHLDTVFDIGDYFQNSSTNWTVTNGYPINGSAGTLSVRNFTSSATTGKMQVLTEYSSNRRWIRSSFSSGTFTVWQEQARVSDVKSMAFEPTYLDAQNLNDITTLGLYAPRTWQNNTAARNYPGVNQSWGLLEVLPTGIVESPMQRWTNADNPHDMYVRRKSGATWSVWKLIG